MATAWRQVWLVYGIGVLAAAQLGIVPPLLPMLRAELRMSLAAAAGSVSIITLIGAAFGLLAGGWSQRLGHARALGIGTAMMVAAAALCAVAENAGTLLVARAAAGFGYLLVVVAGPSLMAALAEPRHHSFTLSLWGTFVPLGIALATSAAGGLAEPLGWRWIFGLDALLLAVVCVAGFALISRTAHESATHRRPNFSLLRAAVPMSFAFFCFALLFLALVGLLPTYFIERRGLSASQAGDIVGAVTACGIPGSLLASRLLRTVLPPRWLAAAGLVLSALAAALVLAVAVPLPLAVAGFALSFAAGGLIPAAAFASVPRLAPDARALGLLNGLLAQAGSVGSLAGPPALATWVDLAGWNTSPVFLLAIAVSGAGCALLSRRA